METQSTNGLIQGSNNVNHPKHYTQGGIECIDAMKAATVGKPPFEAILTGNIIKYLWRYEAKNGLEDVEKAIWYLTRLHKELVDKRFRYGLIVDESGGVVGLETPWGTRMLPKEGDTFNPKVEARAALLKSLLERGGYCPCQPNQSRDTMCPCKNYRENGKCICGLFTKIPQQIDVAKTNVAESNVNDGEVTTNNVEAEGSGVNSEAEDSKEQ